VAFRGDAAFAKPEIYEALEERGVKYAIRIPANDSLERDIAELLTRPVGRPSYKPVVWYKSFLYQAASWKAARRVVAKVEFHFGELFARVGFIVTNLETNRQGKSDNFRWCGVGPVKKMQLAGPIRIVVVVCSTPVGNPKWKFPSNTYLMCKDARLVRVSGLQIHAWKQNGNP